MLSFVEYTMSSYLAKPLSGSSLWLICTADLTCDFSLFSSSYSSSNVADDDINDVAAMGGVNLGEESQRILDSTGFVGTQIRSCKDETFLLSHPLSQRLKAMCEYNEK